MAKHQFKVGDNAYFRANGNNGETVYVPCIIIKVHEYPRKDYYINFDYDGKNCYIDVDGYFLYSENDLKKMKLEGARK